MEARPNISDIGSGNDLAGHQFAKEHNAKSVEQKRVASTPMQKPPLDPDVADAAPTDPVLTVYDEEHLVTYLRLLDAEAEGADWRKVARIVLHLDPEHETDRARRAFDSHLSRAKWMTEQATGTCYGAGRFEAALGGWPLVQDRTWRRCSEISLTDNPLRHADGRRNVCLSE